MNLDIPSTFQSIWQATTPETNYPALEKDLEVDVVVIGGGIAGLNAAYFLKNRGLKIAVIEMGKIVTGTSGNTTAKITSLHGLRYAYLREHFGQDKAQIYGNSNEWAISELQRIIQKENIECDFYQAPSFTYTNSPDDLDSIKQEVETAQKLGLPASFVNSIPGINLDILGAVRFDHQGYFHPRKFLLRIAELINRDGSYIFENTPAQDIKESERCNVQTPKATLLAKSVVIATNLPFYDPEKIFSQLERSGSFVIAAKPASIFPEAMFIGTRGKDMSFRPHKNHQERWLIIGERHNEMGMGKNMNENIETLAKLTKEHFQTDQIEFKWGAADTMSLDKVPYIGRMPGSKNVYVATGFNTWGMTTSFVSAKLLTDLILGEKNDWESLYTPKRLRR